MNALTLTSSVRAFSVPSVSCCAGTFIRNSTSSFESDVLQPSASPNLNALVRATAGSSAAHGHNAEPL